MFNNKIRIRKGSPDDVMAKVQDYSLKLSKFNLQTHCYVHFWTNTVEKGTYHIPYDLIS